MPRPLSLVSLLLLASGCGLGGIVDNGQHPPVVVATATSARHEGLSVLGTYSVDLPRAAWRLAAAEGDTSATLTDGDQRLVLSRPGPADRPVCDGVMSETAGGLELVPCSPTHARLLAPDGDVVDAEHRAGSDDAVRILQSLKKAD